MHQRPKFILLIALIAAGWATTFELASAEQNRTVVHPQDTGAALVNPGMGWVLHYYDNSLTNYGPKLAPSDTVDDFPGLSVVYLRLAWAYLEPEEGEFNWSIVDTPAQRWIAKGKKVAFRFSCTESGEPAYATPQWVERAGAKGHHFEPGKGIDATSPLWEPDYDDPIFLEKLDHFLAAAAARYDENPEVAFVDVGSFGVWGEGHTFWSTKIPYLWPQCADTSTSIRSISSTPCSRQTMISQTTDAERKRFVTRASRALRCAMTASSSKAARMPTSTRRGRRTSGQGFP